MITPSRVARGSAAVRVSRLRGPRRWCARFGPVDAVGAAGHDQRGGGLVEAVQAGEQGELGAVVAVDEVHVTEPLRSAGDG